MVQLVSVKFLVRVLLIDGRLCVGIILYCVTVCGCEADGRVRYTVYSILAGDGDDRGVPAGERELLVEYVLHFIVVKPRLTTRNDHTTVTAPLPVCSAKLSTVGPG